MGGTTWGPCGTGRRAQSAGWRWEVGSPPYQEQDCGPREGAPCPPGCRDSCGSLGQARAPWPAQHRGPIGPPSMVGQHLGLSPCLTHACAVSGLAEDPGPSTPTQAGASHECKVGGATGPHAGAGPRPNSRLARSRVSRLSLCLSQRIGLCGRWVEADGTRRRKGGWAWGWVVLGEQVVLVGAAPCAEVREGACCPTRREGVNWSPAQSWSQHFHVISFNPLQRP